jgi:hypothetical protein
MIRILMVMMVALVLSSFSLNKRFRSAEVKPNSYSSITYERIGDRNVASLTLVEYKYDGKPVLMINYFDFYPIIIHGHRVSDTVMQFTLNTDQLKYLSAHGPDGFSIGGHDTRLKHRGSHRRAAGKYRRSLKRQGVNVKSKAVIKGYNI